MNRFMKIEFTKEMLKEAFLSNKRKRNFMLFKVYESVFSYEHTAEFIAAFISKDLGIPISKSTIDMTRIRVAKKLQTTKQERKKGKTKSVKIPKSVKKETEILVKKEVNSTSSVLEIIPPLPTEKMPVSEFIEPLNTGFDKAKWIELEEKDTKDLGF
jgi:hypothetical protein